VFRTVLVIGASRGIGYAMAEEFVSQGWNVIGTVRGSGHIQLNDLAARHPGRIEVETLDITRPDEIAALRQQRTPGLRYIDCEGKAIAW